MEVSCSSGRAGGLQGTGERHARHAVWTAGRPVGAFLLNYRWSLTSDRHVLLGIVAGHVDGKLKNMDERSTRTGLVSWTTCSR